MHLVGSYTYCRMMHGVYNVKVKLTVTSIFNTDWSKHNVQQLISNVCNLCFCYKMRYNVLLQKQQTNIIVNFYICYWWIIIYIQVLNHVTLSTYIQFKTILFCFLYGCRMWSITQDIYLVIYLFLIILKCILNKQDTWME